VASIIVSPVKRFEILTSGIHFFDGDIQ